MFPKMGKLDPASVEEEERKEAEAKQRKVQDELKKQAEEEAKKKELQEQAQKAMLEEQIGSKMEDLELVDWDEDPEFATQANHTLPPTSIQGEDHSEETIDTEDVSVRRTITKTEAPTTPPPRLQTEDHPVKRDIQFSSPILAAHDYNDDDVFDDFEVEDSKAVGQSLDTPFTSDGTTMDDVATTKDAAAEDEFGWAAEMDGIETNDDIFSIESAMLMAPAPTSTSEMDRMMWPGKF